MTFLAETKAAVTGEFDLPGDLSTEYGARMLAAKIKHYWRKRGYDVETTVKPARFHVTMRSDHYCVRSDLVNGWPQRKLVEDQPAKFKSRV